MSTKTMNCSKCNESKLISELCYSSFRGVGTFSCADEKNCMSLARIENMKKMEEEKLDKERRETHKHLPQEEQIKVVEKFCEDFTEQYGTCISYAIHEADNLKRKKARLEEIEKYN